LKESGDERSDLTFGVWKNSWLIDEIDEPDLRRFTHQLRAPATMNSGSSNRISTFRSILLVRSTPGLTIVSVIRCMFALAKMRPKGMQGILRLFMKSGTNKTISHIPQPMIAFLAMTW